MHQSIKLPQIELLALEESQISPLISKCQIKVCYVGDEPNRNKSIITKEAAKKMAPSLRGAAIVGYFNESNGDFEEHNRSIEIANGELKIKDTTRPYGFVDLNAKVWFQKFLDDGINEREYLMTEGYIWTGQYPEAQRIIDKGNNQSMELDEKFLDATWTKDDNGKPQFFIINEAIISKLCVLGEDCEPCFEGAQITKLEFSLEEGFKQQIYSMMNDIKELLKEGGAEKVFTRYAVEIGDELWNDIWAYVHRTWPCVEDPYSAIYRIEGIFEEDGQKFVILQSFENHKYYRLDFAITEESGFVPSETLIEVTKSYTPAEEPQFALDAIEEYATEYKQKEEDEGKKDSDNEEEGSAELKTDVCPKCGKSLDECECEKKKYNLEEVVEYCDLKVQYDELVEKYDLLEQEYSSLKNELELLKTFKKNIEKKEKLAMVDSFYMLSDEDKADVINNIDSYSIDDIEAKLSIICVRNKVSFDLDENNNSSKAAVTYRLIDEPGETDSATPAWVKSLRATAKAMQN